MAINRTWAERCAEDCVPPQPMRMQSANAPLGGNSPTEVLGVIENTPGNTPLNRPMGGTYRLPGRYSPTGELENAQEWLALQGQTQNYFLYPGQ